MLLDKQPFYIFLNIYPTKYKFVLLKLIPWSHWGGGGGGSV